MWESARTIQQDLAPKDDLTPYAGRWVALRHGHVVGYARDVGDLLDQPEVEPTDAVLAVGAAERRHYIV